MRYDTIVIGAGMSGLAAGIRLARFGRPVVVLERHSLWGGLNSYYKLAGRRFDVGLHALTSCAPAGERSAPLNRALRQLGLSRAELELGEQTGSEIRFPDLTLRFANGPELLTEEVAAAFPGEVEAFAALAELAREFRPEERLLPFRSARAELHARLGEPRLVDALLLPTCFYGSPLEDDVEWQQFLILFRSLFLEGFCRPRGGIRPLLDRLRARFLELGGELRLRSGVRSIRLRDGAAAGVVLDDGSELEAERVFSSAGWAETLELCGPEQSGRLDPSEAGRFSFFESIAVLDRSPRELGLSSAVVFYCDTPELAYRRPAGLVGPGCGVACAPANYRGSEDQRELRLTVLANPAAWDALPESDYAAEKDRCYELARAHARRFLPEWGACTVFRDTFTPRTIRHYTGHKDGLVYGSRVKRWSGETGIGGLVLIGTDQGYLGVVGALVSGISMANRHALLAGSAQA